MQQPKTDKGGWFYEKNNKPHNNNGSWFIPSVAGFSIRPVALLAEAEAEWDAAAVAVGGVAVCSPFGAAPWE